MANILSDNGGVYMSHNDLESNIIWGELAQVSTNTLSYLVLHGLSFF